MKKKETIQNTVMLGGIVVNISMTPNFIVRKFGEGVSAVPIQNFTNTELKQFGKVWVANLIKSANNKRK